MNPERIKTWLSFLLLLGIFLATSLVVIGAIIYLSEQGQKIISYQALSQLSPAYTSINGVIQAALALNPLALILLGFLLLVASQILRVFVVGLFFLQNAEYLLAFSSFFIFIILIYSMLWHE